jgi:hypothetical protein
MIKWACSFLIVFTYGLQDLTAQEKKPIELNTVTVKGNNKPLKESAKGAVLDISKIPNAQTLTLAEILSHIPGIEINGSKISYMGKELTLMRDGVNVAGFSNQIGNSLNSGNINNSYNKIELNLFNLKTEGPTLSFVAPKYDEGYFGNLIANTGTNSSMLMSNVALSTKKNLLNFNTSGNLQYGPGANSNIQTNFNQTQTQDNRAIKSSGTNMKSYQFSLSNSFFINPKNTLNASVSRGAAGYNFDMVNDLQQYQNGLLNNNSITQLLNQSPLTKNPNLAAKLSYVYKPKATEKVNQRFDIALEYDNNDTKNESIANTQSLLNNFLPNSNYNSVNTTAVKNIFGLLGYEYNHSKLGDFEVVARYFNRKSYQSYDYTYQVDTQDNLANLFQDNNINYNYGALLAGWSKTFKGISLRTVIKQDYSSDAIDNLKGRDQFKFITFSPYLSLQRTLKNGNIRLEAQYSQRRPELSSLSNIVNYGAQYNINNVITVGNPYLKPSKSLNLSSIYNTNISVVNLIITGNYVHVNDAISTFETTDTNNVRIRNYRNLATTNGFTGNISLNFYLLPRFTVRLFSNNNFRKYKVDDKETRNTYAWAEGINLGYTPVPNIRLGINGGINGGTSFQSKTRVQINSGLSASYSKRKMNFSLSVNNFHQPYFNTYNWTDGYGYQSFTKSHSRRIMGTLNFNYSFGKITKSAVQGKAIQKDDM